ncbi:GNAT family N-acetyltransferase [Singulisphaera rosea]
METRLLQIRRMTVADIPEGMRLKAQAGWNQLEADWRRLIDLQPDGSFLAEWDGQAIGTVATCRFETVGWVAMMLVDEAFRGRGVGRSLMATAIAALDEEGVRSIRLDATPMGQPLYESLGFKAEAVFIRYEGRLRPAEGTALERSTSTPLVWRDEIASLDRLATGTDRHRLLERLADEDPNATQVSVDDGRLKGFLMSRPGSRARQLGPCIADRDAGLRLFGAARKTYAGESIIVDIPKLNEKASATAEAWGLAPARVLTRMTRGERVVEDFQRLWASAGPEKG